MQRMTPRARMAAASDRRASGVIWSGWVVIMIGGTFLVWRMFLFALGWKITPSKQKIKTF